MKIIVFVGRKEIFTFPFDKKRILMVLPATNWHLPSTSTSIKSCATADFQHPLKGNQGGEQKWGSLCPGKTGRTGLQVDIFRNQFFYPNSYIFSYLEKHWNAFSGDDCSSWLVTFMRLARNLQKISAWLHGFLFHQNHLYTEPPPQQFLKAILNALSWTIVLILPQIKLNLPLLCCVFFKSQSYLDQATFKPISRNSDNIRFMSKSIKKLQA